MIKGIGRLTNIYANEKITAWYRRLDTGSMVQIPAVFIVGAVYCVSSICYYILFLLLCVIYLPGVLWDVYIKKGN